jgi:hypothetical protein
MKKWKEWNMSFHGHVMTEITATKVCNDGAFHGMALLHL